MFRRIAFAAAALSLTTVALAGPKGFRCIDKSHYKIEGEAKPALGAFSGESNDLDVKDEGGKLVFISKLTNVNMGLRDKHTREAFKVDKHPTAKLVVDKSKLKMPGDKEKVDGTVQGDLTLNGVTKPVTVKYAARRMGSDYLVKEAKFSFKYTDFGVEKICKMGVCVEPKVTITVDKMKIREG